MGEAAVRLRDSLLEINSMEYIAFWFAHTKKLDCYAF